MGPRWSDQEEKIIIDKYSTGDKTEILRLIPNRTWNAIVLRALRLGVSRKDFSNQSLRYGNLEKLLDGSLEANYWIGFLLADGNFSKRGGVNLRIGKADAEHIEKYASFLGTTPWYNQKREEVDVSIQNPSVCEELSKRFSLTHRKTYTGAILPDMNDDQFIALLVGFIDGDGNVCSSHRNNVWIRIGLHKSWSGFLESISERISRITGTDPVSVRCHGDRYSHLNIANLSVQSFIKTKAIEMGLPLMERKWDKIDSLRRSRKDKAAFLADGKRLLWEHE